MFGQQISGRCLQCFCAALAAAVLSSAGHAQTVISEVLYDASGSDNGYTFVELHGSPDTALDGLWLEGINGADGGVYLTVTLSGVIPPDGVFVIGDDSGDGTSFIGSADLVAEVDFQNAPDSIVLRNAGAVLDALGYGDFAAAVFAGEGSPAADAPAGKSLARHNPLVDTDNNLGDFIVLDLPTPGTVPPSAIPLPPALGLFLSGVIGLLTVARRKSQGLEGFLLRRAPTNGSSAS